MAYNDTKQAAVDPDNPTANEQIPFSEWNDMVDAYENKIIKKTVDDAAIGNDKVLVYKTATSTFVFEAQSAVGVINDLTDVTISGVPADNEVLAYDTGTSEWINQTAAEAGLATVAGLAAYLPLAGGTMTGGLNMGNRSVEALLGLEAYAGTGIRCKDSGLTTKITLATSTYAFTASTDASMGSHKLLNVTDPTSAQDASTKNYDDTHLFTKEAVTSFTDGYVPVYRTASGKFEMEDGGGAAGLPVVDTNAIVKGSTDGTKLMRFEVDGITTGMTRVLTIQDKDYTIADRDEVLLLSGGTMSGDINLNGNDLLEVSVVTGYTNGVQFKGFAAGTLIEIAYGANAFQAYADADMNSNKVINITNPSSAQDAVTKSYAEKHIGGAAATELTIATGVVTVTQSYHTIDTESDDATDDLVTINGGTAGQVLTIRAINSARTVVAKDGTGNLQIEGDMTLDNAQDTLTLIYDGSNWLETGRANNGA